MSVAENLVRLATCYPCAGDDRPDFSVEFPEVMSEMAYALVIKQIEFRRKCMNQGFDNLLELIEMHRAAATKAKGSVEAARSALSAAEGGGE